MIKVFLSALMSVAILASVVSSARAQGNFQKVAVSGTVYTENGLGKLSAIPLTNKVVMQLCGIDSNFSQYAVVLGLSDGGGDSLRFGIFVVDQSGAVQKGLVEFRNNLQSDDGTNGASVGVFGNSRALLKVVSVLENPKSTGAVLTAIGDKKVPLQILAEVNDNGSPKFILKAKVTVKGTFTGGGAQPM